MLSIFEKNIFFIICFVAVSTGIYIAQEKCPPNEEYLLCGSACPFNCTNPEGPVICTADCVEGCFCKSGYLRDDNSTCVTMDQCVGKDDVCGPNEEFLSCGTACPLTCMQPEPLMCGLACGMGCFCKSGYVRDTVNNQCVTLDKCPVDSCLNQNEVYDICNASCEPSCEDPQPICTRICKGGCICAPGLLRDDAGECVSVDKCGNYTLTDEKCPPNEEYLLCGSACPFNCTNPEGPVICTADCVEGCFCKSGYLRDDNSTCVTMDQCVGKDDVCGPNEEFLSCGTACPQTCKQPEPLMCGIACGMGCFCKSGYVRDTVNNQCVTLDKCPVDSCPNQNEVYDICNASCEPSCEDPQPICTLICKGGCICAPGLLRDDAGECVSVDKCGNHTLTDGSLSQYMNVIYKILHL